MTWGERACSWATDSAFHAFGGFRVSGLWKGLRTCGASGFQGFGGFPLCLLVYAPELLGLQGLGSFLSPEECRHVGVGCIALVRVASSWFVCWIGEFRVRSLWSVAKNLDFSNGPWYGSVAISRATMMITLERISKTSMLMAIIPVARADGILVVKLQCDDLQ